MGRLRPDDRRFLVGQLTPAATVVQKPRKLGWRIGGPGQELPLVSLKFWITLHC